MMTNKKARVIFDGEDKGITEPNIPFKVTTTEGEHYARVQYQENGSITSNCFPTSLAKS